MDDFSNNLFSFLLVLLKPNMSFNFHSETQLEIYQNKKQTR